MPEEVRLSDESYARLEEALGQPRRELESIPAAKLARALAKLETRNRPQARIEQQQIALRGRAGRVPDACHEHAFRQVGEMHAACRARRRHKAAGVPVGSPPAAANGGAGLALTAGLAPDNTGWTPLGPGNIGGRTRAIVIDPANPARVFTATAGGGVWRSADGGASWAPTDDLMANLAACSLAMDPNDADTLYVGTGEGFGNVDAIRGDGIFVTHDGGVTWTGLASTRSNPDFHFVNALAFAADGQTLLAGTTRGIFRSTDAGQSWTRELAEPIGNLVCHPTDASRAIAGRRDSGRAYFSTDGGASWQEAARPTANGDRVQVCYSAADPTVTYASVDAAASQLWRSTDGGQTYVSRNAELADGRPADFLGGQGWYDNALWAGDPTDSDLVIAGGVDLWRSTDGGDTFARITAWWDDDSAHADHHAIVSDPGYDGAANRRVWFGNDGGVYRTDDVTTVTQVNGWTGLNNGYAATQFYYADGHLGTNTVLGGAQDNGTLRYTPAQGENGWNETFGGDGGDVASDPSDPQIWYGEYVNMEIFRNTNGGSSGSFVDDTIVGRFWNDAIGGWDWKPAPFGIAEVLNGQAQFIAPFELDPSDPTRILGGAMSLWRTNDARTPNTDASGPSWAAIKAPIGNSRWTHSITAIAIAPSDSDIVYVGHANGDVYRSDDATGNAPTWTRIDTNGIQADRACLALAVDPDDPDLVYAAFAGYEPDNLWRSADGGQGWTDISGGLPDAPIHDVSLHPQRSTWVYLGTQVGVFASEDGGASWSPTNEGPTNVSCYDLFWMGCKLVCVTHGRGMFEIDLPIANALPRPILAFTGTEVVTTASGDVTRYRLPVTNRADYPDSLFRASPDLPPCGSNTTSSRTWVDLFDADTDQRLNGFCALTRADALGSLWFGLPQGDSPPSRVYVVLRDRRCSASYTSDPVAVTAGPVGAPAIRNPAPGSTLSDATVTFEWTPGGANVSQWWLYAGPSQGSRQYYDSGSLGTALFETVTGLPTDGSTVHVRLWHREAGTWNFTDAQYTALAAGPPEITSPLAGSTLSEQVTFEWSARGAQVSQWWLYVGSSQGSSDLHNSGSLGTSLFETVPGLPDDGRTVHVRLWYRQSAVWQFVDTQYTARTAGVPAITSPPPGSTLTGSSVTFDWESNGAQVSLYWIYVGTSPGAHDVFDSGPLGTRLSTVLTGFPEDGSEIIVRLWYRSGGVWRFADHHYTSS